jgi:peptide/nickel transport system permease protein
MLSRPSAEHWFGTDQYGRDVSSPASSTARAPRWPSASSRRSSAARLGALIGAASGYFGGRIDTAIQRVVDIMLSFPDHRAGAWWSWPCSASARLRHRPQPDRRHRPADRAAHGTRVAGLDRCRIVAMPFIDAARAAGFGHSRIILRHIVPNIVAPYLIMVSRFDGAGHPAGGEPLLPGPGRDRADAGLGADAVGGRRPISTRPAPWMILFPGVAITLAVFAFNLFGDSLRDWLDPKLKSWKRATRLLAALCKGF